MTFSLTVVFTWSCRRVSNPVGPPSIGSGYFPNTIGSYWVYEVFDSIAMRRYTKDVRIADTVRLNDVLVQVWARCDTAKCDTLFLWVDRDTVWRYFLNGGYDREIMYVLPLVVGQIWPRRFGGRDTVSTLETMIVQGQLLNAYRVDGVWGGFNVRESEGRWFVPYVGLVKRYYRCVGFCDDNETWELKHYVIP